MDPNDQENTSFVTGQGTYYYQEMPFGLKNAGATYQRLVNRMFQKQIGTSMEVYIDDILGRPMRRGEHSAQNLFKFSSHLGKPFRGGTPYHLFSCLKFLNQSRPGQRARQGTAANLILQPSSKRRGRKVPKDGEINPSIGDHCQEASTIFPGSYY